MMYIWLWKNVMRTKFTLMHNKSNCRSLILLKYEVWSFVVNRNVFSCSLLIVSKSKMDLSLRDSSKKPCVDLIWIVENEVEEWILMFGSNWYENKRRNEMNLFKSEKEKHLELRNVFVESCDEIFHEKNLVLNVTLWWKKACEYFCSKCLRKVIGIIVDVLFYIVSLSLIISWYIVVDVKEKSSSI